MTERVQQAVPYSVQAADIMRTRILGGEYELGQRLNEVELSSSLGISRSPVREAMRLLANEGLVDIVAGRGVFVADFGVEQARDLLEIREALDVLATRLAAGRANDEEIDELESTLNGHMSALRTHGAATTDWSADFHMAIYELARNESLTGYARSVHTKLRLVRFRSGSSPGRTEEAYQEHLAILEAIRVRDPALGAERMRDHLQHSSVHILEQLEHQGGSQNEPT